MRILHSFACSNCRTVTKAKAATLKRRLSEAQERAAELRLELERYRAAVHHTEKATAEVG
jgi:hypothetical protein